MYTYYLPFISPVEFLEIFSFCICTFRTLVQIFASIHTLLQFGAYLMYLKILFTIH